MNTSFNPSLEAGARTDHLKCLLVPGEIEDPELLRRAARLDSLFRSSVASCPVPCWSHGLVLDREGCNVTENFLPISAILPAFRRLVKRSLTYPLCRDPFPGSHTWPDFLTRYAPCAGTTNPASLLRLLMSDGSLRRTWLFALFLPRAHGGGFDRYPAQAEYLGEWLARRRTRSGEGISCLDAACGTGEGTWELAEHLSNSGFRPGGVTIRGSSLEPLELFAAAHAAFPHDPGREREYRLRIRPLVAAGFTERMHFVREDLALPCGSAARYDLILCNGLLGGPLLHEPATMAQVVAGLVRRLKPGGVLLAADRFHEGWRKLVPKGKSEALLAGCGMRILEIGEGIGGELPET